MSVLPLSPAFARPQGLSWKLLQQLLLAASTTCLALPAVAVPRFPLAAPSDPIVQAHDAFERRDRARVAALRQSTAAAGHPLAMWPAYWDLSARLRHAGPAEVTAFLTRWSGTHVEDQLRKEWILELGRRRDWGRIAVEAPKVRVNDNREVVCYALLMRHQAGEDVTVRGRAEWFAQREADHGCAQLAGALYADGKLTRDDIWARARVAAEQNRRFVAQHAVGLLGAATAAPVRQVFLQPSAWLARRSANPGRDEAELQVLAIIRLASRSPQAAAQQLLDKRSARLPPVGLASAWNAVGKQAVLDLHPQAVNWFLKAPALPAGTPLDLTDDTLAWKVRAALRDEATPQRWALIIEAVDAMSPEQRTDPAWLYWRARALKATAPAGPTGDAQRTAAAAILEHVAGRLHFYGRPAAEELGRSVRLPERPAPLTEAERAAAQANPSLTRALALIELKLRDEAASEWNHGLHGLDDRALLAAAQRACDAEVWNRCMNTSERTRNQIDVSQRFPTPFRDHVDSAAREADIDAALIYSVIRQESHFSRGVRSVAGASGLMQVMPQTARWTARRYRIPYRPDLITDPATNVRIGTRYLKMVLDQFDGSHALAAAAYNAGPNRPRRWRNGSETDIAAWIEVIPFNETRDYVKGVLSNAAYYGAMLAEGGGSTMRTSLAEPASPRPVAAPANQPAQ